MLTLEQEFDQLFEGKLELCGTCRQLNCDCDEQTEALMERERECDE